MQHRLIKRGGSKLLVLLPSANKKPNPPVPYFARITWVDDLPSCYDCLYVSDPYAVHMQKYGGSWLIDPKTKRFDIDLIRNCVGKYAQNYDEIVVHGSSMGGYLALMLASTYDKIIAECPQIYLDKYPDSAQLLIDNKIDINSIDSIAQILSRNVNNKHVEIHVNVSDHHHIDTHILPFYSAITRTKRPALHINDYGQTGHVAMSKEQLSKLL